MLGKMLRRKKPKTRTQPRRLPRVLSPAEARRLLAAAAENPKYQAVVAIALYAGLRRVEIAKLKVGDIDIEQRLIRVQQGKGGRDAIVPLVPNLLPYLRPLLDREREAPLVPGKDGTRGFSPRHIQWIVHRVAERAGLSADIHTHTLRHTFGTEIQRRGRDLAKTQRLLRHVSVTTTQIYVHLSVEDIRPLADELDFEP